MTDHQPDGRLRSTRASTVTVRRVEWWEPQWIPQAALTLLAGREGIGKSTVAVHWAARASRADGPVLWIDTEESRDSVIVPRLTAAGADLDRVEFLDPTADGARVALPGSADDLDQFIGDLGIRLVVADPIKALMASGLKDDDRDVRRFLEPLVRIAERRRLPVLGLIHFGKRDSADSGKLMLGSIAWSQVPRSVLTVAADSDSGQLIVTNTKSNLAARTMSMDARIVGTTITSRTGETIDTSRLDWIGETSRDARELLARPDSTSGHAAAAFVRDFLAAGPQWSADLLDAGRKAGFSKSALDRARQTIECPTRRIGTRWRTALAEHADRLAAEDPTSEEGPTHADLGMLGPSRSEGVSRSQKITPNAQHPNIPTSRAQEGRRYVPDDHDAVGRADRLDEDTVESGMAPVSGSALPGGKRSSAVSPLGDTDGVLAAACSEAGHGTKPQDERPITSPADSATAKPHGPGNGTAAATAAEPGGSDGGQPDTGTSVEPAVPDGTESAARSAVDGLESAEGTPGAPMARESLSGAHSAERGTGGRAGRGGRGSTTPEERQQRALALMHTMTGDSQAAAMQRGRTRVQKYLDAGPQTEGQIRDRFKGSTFLTRTGGKVNAPLLVPVFLADLVELGQIAQLHDGRYQLASDARRSA